jgi:hypothetical protein
MAIEHARICGACERECPSWASRCPTCGSLSLVHRITIVPPSAPIATIAEAKPARRKTSRPRIAASRESPRPASARAGSTA